MANSIWHRVVVRTWAGGLLLWICLALPLRASADPKPEPQDPRFAHFVDQRTVPQGAFEQAELTSHDLGRSFALLVGVNTYPGLPVEQRRLTAAGRDIYELALYLRQQEFFDEIVVLQNEDVTEDNLHYFLQVYFPERLQQHPRSRFLFAYSGHGFRSGDRCYLLQTDAESSTDRAHAMSAEVLMARYREVIGPAFRSLALINGCHLDTAPRRNAADRPWTLKDPGHHVISAEGSTDATWQADHVGPGSRFYETLLDGITGREDRPSTTDVNGDGLVDVVELETHLRRHVRFERRSGSDPRATQLSRSGDRGGFFFFEGRRQVEAGVIEETPRGRSLAKRFGRPLPAETTPELATFLRTEAAQRAAGCRQGNGRDCRRLGLSYEFGKGVDLDLERAAGLYQQACELGNAKGCSYLAILYYQGKGVDKDPALETHYDRLSCDGGSMRGCNNLAASYLIGHGVGKSPRRAIQLLDTSCKNGDAWGCMRLGVLYRQGDDVSTDPLRAADLLQKACDGGNETGCQALGQMYAQGQGVSKDPARAAGLHYAACHQDNARACNELGILYWNGHGVQQDLGRAFALFRKACRGEDLTGCNNIGIAYENGDSVPKSIAKALKIFRDNCDAGSKLSCDHLERLTRRKPTKR